MADVEVDLYDTIEEDFTQEGDYGNGDLYDDVITSSSATAEPAEVKEELVDDDPDSLSSQTQQGSGDSKFLRRWSLYVSNLTWWTTDSDVIEACKAIGVNDVVEVKFYENRSNGQSKGFATVTLGSEASMRTIMEKLKSQMIHSQAPAVHYCNRSNLQMLDAAAGGSKPEQEPIRNGAPNAMGPRLNGPVFQGGPRGPRPPPYMGGRPPGPGGMGPRQGPMRGPPLGMQGPPNGMQGPPMGMRHQGPLQHMGGPGHRGPPMGPGMGPGYPMPGPPGYNAGPPPGMMGHGMPSQMPPQQMLPSAPVPHVNPAFFSAGQPPPVDPYRAGAILVDAYGRPIEGQPVVPPPSSVPEMTPAPQPISEEEFNEILTRNKSVCSSAISRAVQDASAGEYGSAIETLVTAISLIKQSKIASDDRCKILITSLQDTKQGIEDKSYGSRSSGASREKRGYSSERDSRERRRSRSRERDSRRRERSRSRERERAPVTRDYRERSRDRERYYAERRGERYH